MAYQDPEVDIKQMQNQRYKIEDIDLDIIDWIKKIRSRGGCYCCMSGK